MKTYQNKKKVIYKLFKNYNIFDTSFLNIIYEYGHR